MPSPSAPLIRLRMDHLVGSVEPGKYADFAILHASPFDVAPRRNSATSKLPAPFPAAPSTPPRRGRDDRQTEMDQQMTFTVIGGFLGAGKTSLLNDCWRKREDIRFAVLVNDFGALNIDQSLIASADSRIMQLSNGCICCSLAGGLG